MKTLVLMRHAKSSWDDLTLPDFDRTLNKRGKESAPRMGQFFKEKNFEPDLILCSPAKRTKQTATLFLEAAGLEEPVHFDQRIYEADVARLLDVLADIEENRRNVLIIGHNPGMSDLNEFLTGQFEDFTTATIAQLTLSSPKWNEIKPRSGNLDWIKRPKEDS